MRGQMSKPKPVVVYLHRYPPEIEALQWPGLRALIAELAPAYELVYLCMGPADGRRDAALREPLRVEELPFGVDQSSGRDKWLKTLRWYGSLGRLLARIRELRPAAILCKEALPGIPARVAALAESLCAGGPCAQRAARELIAAVHGRPLGEATDEDTAQRIARQRATAEAREGIAAFLEKRPADWLR